MAEALLSAVLSGVFSVLFDRMATQEFLKLFQGKRVLANLLNELKIRLLSANKLLKDAEVKQLTDENVKKWLDELQEVLYEADRIIDKINTEALRRKVEEGDKPSSFLSSISTFFSAFENTVKSEIEEILGRLKDLLDQNDVLGLKEGDQKLLPQRVPAPLVEESDVYGRKKDKKKIVKFLLSNDVGSPKLSVIAIVGMGGLGKTTLAQLVYNDSKVREHFDLIAWVTVSEVFDVFEVTKALFGKTNKDKSRAEDLYQLQVELKNSLKKKKFLFVLDDVWNEDYNKWESLQKPLRSGRHGSKIIVTTRSMNVVSTMHNVRTHNLPIISDDDCLQLFKKHGFDSANLDALSNFQEIGIQIVKRCKGLPLAVKSIAGVLRSTQPEQWRSILQSDLWELHFQEKHDRQILPALWLSYHFLPAHLKRCFTFFSIFPKGYAFEEYQIESIIRLWMAEGLLQPQEGKRTEDIGVEYFKELKARSFFQQSSWDKSTLVMHDLIHDLAASITGGFYLAKDGFSDSCKPTSKTYHLSYSKSLMDKMELLDGLFEAKCLRTFLALPLSFTFPSKSTPNDRHQLLLPVGGSLRVLSLSSSSATELPDSIGDAKHLRYLDLSGTKVEELPSSVCTLYNLQTLLLSFCDNLKHLPTNMSSLISLRHLEIICTPLKEMPPHMCKLRNLQTLSDFVLGENGGSRIKELGELQYLHGRLRISGLENVEDVGDVLEANLKTKEHLTELILEWSRDYVTADTAKERELLDALEPHRKLKALTIEGYGGTTFPDWVAHHSFGDMVEVCLLDCKNCCSLPPLGQLPSLKELYIQEMERVSVLPTIQAERDSAYPSLECVVLYGCPGLESFSGIGFPPNLTQLDIDSCPRLIANRIKWDLQRFPCLKSLYLDGSEFEGAVDSFPEEGLLPSTLTHLQIERIKNLKTLNGKGLKHLTSLQHFAICQCYQFA